MSLFSGAAVGGYYLFAVPDWTIYLALVLIPLGVAYASYLLSAPQPAPDPTEWSKNR